MAKVWSRIMLLSVVLVLGASVWAEDTVKIGFSYPQSGPFTAQGKDQANAVQLAVEEINAAGGILGKKVVVVERDSKADAKQAAANATELIDQEKVAMIFGGVSSLEVLSVSDTCSQKGMLFMATVAGSNAVTCEKAHRTTFRACANAWMSGNSLANYLKKSFSGKKYFYVVADYSWGLSCEASLRSATGTEDAGVHKVIRTPFPGATDEDFKKAIEMAKMVKPDVVVLVLFGKNMTDAIRLATMEGLKDTAQLVVPVLELNQVHAAGPKVMEGVIGAMDWCWQVPYKYNHDKGKAFVETYATRFNQYPCWGALAAYNTVKTYAEAAKKAGSLDVPAVITALEGYRFTLLKDESYWRDFDHQLIQTDYIAKCKPSADVVKDKFKMDYFEVLDKFAGDDVAETRAQWNASREKAKLPTQLEALPTGLAQTPATQQK